MSYRNYVPERWTTLCRSTFLVAAATVIALGPGAASADWLVMNDGSRVETQGPSTRPDLFPTRDHALAYYLNAYNAQVFAGVLWTLVPIVQILFGTDPSDIQRMIIFQYT